MTSRTREPPQVVQALLEASMAVDVEVMGSLFSEGLITVEPDVLPYGGTHIGRDAFFGDVAGWLLQRFNVTAHDIELFPAADAVAVRMVVEFTSHATGAVHQAPYVEVYTVQDGAVMHLDVYPQDAAAVAAWMSSNDR